MCCECYKLVFVKFACSMTQYLGQSCNFCNKDEFLKVVYNCFCQRELCRQRPQPHTLKKMFISSLNSLLLMAPDTGDFWRETILYTDL